MTDHAATYAPELAHSHAHDSTDPHAADAGSLKFEPVEIQDFILADKTAGQMMGKLLGFLFCVLLTLMTGVNIWMISHKAQGTDPQAPIVTETSPAAAHH